MVAGALEKLGLEIIVKGFEAANKKMTSMGGKITTLASKFTGLSKIGGTVGKALASVAKVGIAVVGAAAIGAAGAIVGLGTAFLNLAKDAAPLEGIGIAFESMSETYGVSLEAMQAASKGMISDFELMRQANVALSGAGEQFGTEFGENLPKLLAVAQAAARATGQDAGFLFESLVTGIKRTSPMLIDNTGLQLRLGEANAALAEQLGKSVDELSAEERQIALLNATLEAGQKMVDDFGGGQLTAAEKMAQAQAQIQNMKDQIGLALLPALSGLMDAFSTVWEDVGPEVIAFFEELGVWLGENLPIYIENFRAWWAEAWPQIQQFVSDAWEVIQEVFTTVQAWLEGDGPAALEGWKTTFETVWGVITQVIADFQAWWDENSALILATGETLSAFWNDNLLPAIQTAWEMITLIIGFAVEAIQSLLVVAMEVINGNWEGAWTAFTEFLSNTWAAIETLLAGTLEIIANLFGSSMAAIGETWSGNWENIKTIFSTAWDTMIAWLIAAWTVIKTQVRTSLLLIAGVIVGGLLLISNYFTEKWTAISDFVTETWETIKTNIGNFLEQIQNTISNAVDNFKTLGENLMTGLKDGIINKALEVVAAVVAAVNDAVAAAKAAVGIDSPSKVFMEMGQNTMKGMALGVAQLSPIVQAQMQMATVPQPIGSPIAAPGGNTFVNNYNLTTQSLTQPGGLALEFEAMDLASR